MCLIYLATILIDPGLIPTQTYVSDLGQWLKHSVAGTYADDTQTSVSGKDLQS